MNKLQWKHQYKIAINNYWSKTYKDQSANKSTLKHLCVDQVEIGKPHQIWQSIGSSVTEVKRSINHCRIATGTYLLQTNIAKFSNNKETATCPLCGLEEEDMTHMLTSCILLHGVRKTHLLRLKNIIIGYIGLRQWNEFFSDKQSITQLIVDPSYYSKTMKSLSNLAHITKATSEMCYEIHHKRLILKLELNIT
ncbi:unnamed protein product [Mytilus coruscus]|uniref:Reverse transcriptase zinc-binding domain-containing protein n=1 Tax=Mytilus coruscus TaxID=42192 RepID=A0A6J8A7A9_MYTCO|nr:unnamed protein product [Mytilus coruscus]